MEVKSMEEEFGKDIIDGKIVDLSKLTTNELLEMRDKLKKREEEILKEIDKELEKYDDERE